MEVPASEVELISPSAKQASVKGKLRSTCPEPTKNDQAARGGGVGGDSARGCPESGPLGRTQKGCGGLRSSALPTSQKSSLVSTFEVSCFCSDCLPSCTTLQILHGCRPSKVFRRAVLSVSVCANFTVMLSQATDCNTAQCPPIAKISERTTSARAIFNRLMAQRVASRPAKVKREPNQPRFAKTYGTGLARWRLRALKQTIKGYRSAEGKHDNV